MIENTEAQRNVEYAVLLWIETVNRELLEMQPIERKRALHEVGLLDILWCRINPKNVIRARFDGCDRKPAAIATDIEDALAGESSACRLKDRGPRVCQQGGQPCRFVATARQSRFVCAQSERQLDVMVKRCQPLDLGTYLRFGKGGASCWRGFGSRVRSISTFGVTDLSRTKYSVAFPVSRNRRG